MNTEHHFNIKEAEKHGVVSAVLLYNIRYWLKKNKANNKHERDGRIWMYNSVSAFSELFPYLTENQIRHALKKLCEDGILIKDKFNRHQYDRTLWYTIDEIEFITDRIEIDDKSISEISQNHLGNFTNGSEKIHQPIPNNKPDNKQQIENTDNNSLRQKTLWFIDFWNELYDAQVRFTEKKQKQVANRLKLFSPEEIVKSMENRSKDSWLENNGYMKDWESYWRNDEKVERYLNKEQSTSRVYGVSDEELPF